MKLRKLWTVAAIAGMTLGASMASAETYALLVGINDYPDVLGSDGQPLKDEKGNPINTDLAGAVNDIKIYNDLFTKKYNIKPGNVRMLLDKDANEKGFLDGWKWLLSTAKPGDEVIFCYSGHGGQIDADDEDDKTEEVIVLADNMLVPGDLFGELARSMRKAGINSSFVFDSCFSGGMSRNAITYDGKATEARQKVLDAKTLSRMTRVPDARFAEVKAMPKAAQTTTAEYAFIFAGAEDQPTTDLDFKDPNTPDRGVFSLLFGTLLEKSPEVTLTDAVEAIKMVLKEKKFDQVPGFEFSSPERGRRPLLKSQ